MEQMLIKIMSRIQKVQANNNLDPIKLIIFLCHFMFPNPKDFLSLACVLPRMEQLNKKQTVVPCDSTLTVCTTDEDAQLHTYRLKTAGCMRVLRVAFGTKQNGLYF